MMRTVVGFIVFLTALVAVECALSSTQQTEMLNLHKTRRSQVSPAASNMQTMVWSTCVASLAQTHANKCVWQHSSSSSRTNKCNFGYIGENIAYGTGTTYAPASSGHTKMVDMWWAEKQWYTYSSNSCASNKVCGHYTQMVWYNSNNLGCAHASCSFGHFYVCNYAAGGNYAGQKPYAQKTRSIQVQERASCGNTTCDPNASCVSGYCSCNDPYVGDGASCYFPDPLWLNGFEVARGDDNWVIIGGNEAEVFGNNTVRAVVYVGSQNSVLHWKASDHYTSSTATIASVTIDIEDSNSNDWGLCMRYQDQNNMACFTCETTTGKLITSVFKDGEETRRDFSIPCNYLHGNDTTNNLTVVDQKTYFQIYMNGVRVGPTILIPFFSSPGGVALRASGNAAFMELSVLTKRRLVMTLTSCVNSTYFQQKIANILGIDAQYVQNVAVSNTCSSGTVQVTFTLQGNGNATADSLYSRLDGLVSSKDQSLSDLQVFSLETAAEEEPSDSVKFELFTKDSIPQTVALGVGVIVGIAIGAFIMVSLMGYAGKKGYDYYRLRGSASIEENGKMSALYRKSGRSGKNPLFEGPSKDVPMSNI